MDLSKSFEFFDPNKVTTRCHIIGCGSVGSSIAELLVRLGITDIALYDFDDVEPHNVSNQMFTSEDFGKRKVDAVKEMCVRINPDTEHTIVIKDKGWTENTKLSGFVFLCVDNIELRKQIVEKNKPNKSIIAMFDFRTGLLESQHYAADWSKAKQVDGLLKSMDFTHDEAKANVPQTACHLELGIAPTVRMITAFGVTNFINFVIKDELKKIIIIDANTFDVSVF